MKIAFTASVRFGDDYVIIDQGVSWPGNVSSDAAGDVTIGFSGIGKIKAPISPDGTYDFSVDFTAAEVDALKRCSGAGPVLADLWRRIRALEDENRALKGGAAS